MCDAEVYLMSLINFLINCWWVKKTRLDIVNSYSRWILLLKILDIIEKTKRNKQNIEFLTDNLLIHGNNKPRSVRVCLSIARENVGVIFRFLISNPIFVGAWGSSFICSFLGVLPKFRFETSWSMYNNRILVSNSWVIEQCSNLSNMKNYLSLL